MYKKTAITHLTKLLASTLITSALSLPALAADNMAYPTLVHAQDGTVVHNNYQECWGTGPNNVTHSPNIACGQQAPAPAPVVIPTPIAAMAPAPVVTAPAPSSAPTITLSADALFDFNKAVLKPKGKTLIEEELKKTQWQGGTEKIKNVRVVGYTDSIGSRAYNDKLSLRRAAAVKAFLVSHEISAERIHVEGKGMSNPVASNKTKEGRAQNRRAEIWFDPR